MFQVPAPGTLPPVTEYRPEIDGLRAVAVTAVVLYHLGVPGVTGGFVGVDVFFVISGYVITWQLWSHRAEPLWQMLSGFYARRARRIVPALAIVVIATLALGKVFLLPYGEQQGLSRSAIATMLFIANVYFRYGATDYFAQPAELQPLLHTWSLAVEEQFYLLWPLLLGLIWMIPRRRTGTGAPGIEIAAVALLTAISFHVSLQWSYDAPLAAFFLLPARFWELGVGAGLALWVRAHGPPKLPAGVATAGLFGIVAAVLVITRAMPFPGCWALLPVASCALIIATGERDSVARRILTSRPMVFTGTVSYSWYLWHWPLLALVRCMNVGDRAPIPETAAVVVAYGLACLSTLYVENPIRRQRWRIAIGTPKALATGVALMLVTVALSGVLWLDARARNRDDLLAPSGPCIHVPGVFTIEDRARCALAEGTAGVVFLVGDSHAAHWGPAIAAWAESTGLRAVERTYAACVPPTHGLSHYSPRCEAFSRSVLVEIAAAAAKQRTLVVLGARWPFHPDLLRGSPTSNPLSQLLTELEHLGVPTVLIAASPQFAHPIPECVARRGERACTLARAAHDSSASGILRLLQKTAAEHRNVKVLDPTPALCDAHWCYPMRDGILMFRDVHHLSRNGALVALPAIRGDLDWLLDVGREGVRR